MQTTLLSLIRTDRDFVPALARITLAAAMLPHGAQKLLGWFGGYGFTNTMHWFTESMQIPWIFAFAAIVAESFGALALLAGFGARIAALGLGAVYLTAALMSHVKHGFFMNWAGAQAGEGIEYFILALALVAIVVIRGAGALSVDNALAVSRLSR